MEDYSGMPFFFFHLSLSFPLSPSLISSSFAQLLLLPSSSHLISRSARITMCDSCIPLLSTSVRLALTEEAKEENAFDNRAGAPSRSPVFNQSAHDEWVVWLIRQPSSHYIPPPPVTPSFLFLDSIPPASRRFHHQK